MGKLLWPLLVVKLRILGLIWRGTAYFVKTTQLLSYLATLDELRASCHAERRQPIFGAKLEPRRHKVFHIFSFLQSDEVFETVNPFSCIFKAISSEKRCLISVPFLTCELDVRTVKFLPPAESWLVNSNFPRASRMQSTLFASGVFAGLSREELALPYFARRIEFLFFAIVEHRVEGAMSWRTMAMPSHARSWVLRHG